MSGDGGRGGAVVIITGPPGAGKTTVAAGRMRLPPEPAGPAPG